MCLSSLLLMFSVSQESGTTRPNATCTTNLHINLTSRSLVGMQVEFTGATRLARPPIPQKGLLTGTLAETSAQALRTCHQCSRKAAQHAQMPLVLLICTLISLLDRSVTRSVTSRTLTIALPGLRPLGPTLSLITNRG